MKDLLQEVKELEKRIAGEQRTVDVYSKSETLDEDGRFWSERYISLESVEQLVGWLTELLEIKKARLSVEVFMQQEYDMEPDPEEEPEEPDTGVPCSRCGGELREKNGQFVCDGCGARRAEL